MSRPKSKDPRKWIIKTNLTDEEMERVDRAAFRHGWTTAGFLRLAILEKCGEVEDQAKMQAARKIKKAKP